MRLALCLLVVAAPMSAQQADSLLARRVDSVFAPWSSTNSPGCALGVDRGGMPLLRRAYGMMNLETGTPWTVGTISESGSVAKQFVAAAIVLLARDGEFTLEDDITRWIPEAKGFGKKITIRQLLSHTSGIPDRYTLHQVQGRPAGQVDHTMAEVMDLVGKLRDLNFDPGTDYEYSNTGLLVATTLLERASGKSLQAFTDTRLFKPLGMTHTRWREDHRTVVAGRASAYDGNSTSRFRNDHPFTRTYGAGGLLTTVDDWLRWEAALQKGEGEWGAVRDSLERGTRLLDGTELTYGLGVVVSRFRGVRSITHTGSTGGYRAALQRYPEQDVAIALLCNLGSINPGTVAQRVAALVLGSALAAVPAEPTAIAVDPAELARLAGAYHAPRTEESLILAVQDGNLVDSTGGRTVLIPIAPGRFKFRGSQRTLTVLPAGSGGPRTLRVEAPSTRAVDYELVPRPMPDAATLAAYAGEYRSDELDARVRLSASHDTLRLELEGQPAIVLRPRFRDGFSAGGEVVRFERDRRGRVSGLVLWAGRVRHLRFVRGPVTA